MCLSRLHSTIKILFKKKKGRISSQSLKAIWKESVKFSRATFHDITETVL
jgi:hypothetical protein